MGSSAASTLLGLVDKVMYIRSCIPEIAHYARSQAFILSITLLCPSSNPYVGDARESHLWNSDISIQISNPTNRRSIPNVFGTDVN
jgi:hypothetical protein